MKNIKILLAVSITLFLFSMGLKNYNNSVNLYNKTVELKSRYTQKVQEEVTNYDSKYLMFVEKTKITELNKETFVNVTNIIMNGRKDGEGVAWKWVQENQQIPYQEFTSFYKELSSFITEQYSSILAIEKEKQQISYEHNNLLKTYPNNIYNYFLNIEEINYSFGYITDSTLKKFKK